MEKKLVIVTPIYEDTKSAKKLILELQKIFREKLYIVAVDDGSVNEPVNIKLLDDNNSNGVILRLTKNIGHQAAIAVGLNYVANKIGDMKVYYNFDAESESERRLNVEGKRPNKSKFVRIIMNKNHLGIETVFFQFNYFTSSAKKEYMDNFVKAKGKRNTKKLLHLK